MLHTNKRKAHLQNYQEMIYNPPLDYITRVSQHFMRNFRQRWERLPKRSMVYRYSITLMDLYIPLKLKNIILGDVFNDLSLCNEAPILSILIGTNDESYCN